MPAAREGCTSEMALQAHGTPLAMDSSMTLAALIHVLDEHEYTDLIFVVSGPTNYANDL